MTDELASGGHELNAPPWSRVEGTLMSTSRAVRDVYERSFAEIGLGVIEAGILAHVGDAGPLSQVEVARRVSMSRARIGVYIDDLEGRGAVERRPDPNDRRVWLIRLTPAGREMWASVSAIDQDIRRRLRSGISAAERNALDDILSRIERNARVARSKLDDRAAGTLA